MGEVQYFRIKNWEHYQHRDHKKSWPWIKLYVSLLDDEKFNYLSENYQLFWIKLLMLSGRNGNEFVWDSKRLRKLLHTNSYIKLEKFEELQLIEKYTTRSGRAEDAVSPSLDKRRGEKIRKGGVESTTSLNEMEKEFILEKMKQIGKKVK